MPPFENMIEVTNLRREYRVGKGAKATTVVALDDVSLTIQEGEVHGLLGPNGAGKTTLCKILSTVLTPSSGEARVYGRDVVSEAERVRRLLGLVLGGDRGLYPKLTARENLEFWAAMYGISRRETRSRIDDVLSKVGLHETDYPVERFSRGMKQRLHLARGLMPQPRVLLLDEPTTGMDPVAAMAFRDLVHEVKAQGMTVLITTHDMAEAEAVCDRVTLIDNGRILATASPNELSRLISTFERIDVQKIEPDEAHRLALHFQSSDLVAAATISPNGALRIETKVEGAVEVILRELLDLGHVNVSVGRPGLDEVYVHVIGDRGMNLK